jgi:hypothetical protein
MMEQDAQMVCLNFEHLARGVRLNSPDCHKEPEKVESYNPAAFSLVDASDDYKTV